MNRILDAGRIGHPFFRREPGDSAVADVAASLKLFVAVLLLGAILIGLARPKFGGDAMEYTLSAVASARHLGADIRPGDIALAREILPELDWAYPPIERHWSAGEPLPVGLVVDRHGDIRAIHFPGYSMLAAIPLRIALAAGGNPMKGFLWVDLVCLAILAVAALRYFGTVRRALATLGVFLLTVGMPYWNWASPEYVCAALGLAALLFMGTGAFVRAGVLIGLAAMQNPPIGTLLAFGPAIVLVEQGVFAGGVGAVKTFLRTLWWRIVLGGVLGGALACIPVAMSLHVFGTWNIIATSATDPGLVSGSRLLSYYLDWNQGMIIAIPAVWGALAWMLLRRPGRLALVIPVMLASLALALPALSTHNWNAGSQGMMRYVAWGSVPFIYLLLALLRPMRAWPLAGLALFVVLQLACVVHGKKYQHTEFSPLARWVLRHAPQYYNPEPEIFSDRVTHQEAAFSPDNVVRYERDGVRKTLYHAGSEHAVTALCGHRGLPTAASTVTASPGGWTYLHGDVACVGGPVAFERFGMGRVQRQDGAALGEGWSGFEMTSDDAGGVWSIGDVSTLVLDTRGRPARAISIRGYYAGSNRTTRVLVNGKDLGEWRLSKLSSIPLDGIDGKAPLAITLRHQAPAKASPQDGRVIAFHLQDIVVTVGAGQ